MSVGWRSMDVGPTYSTRDGTRRTWDSKQTISTKEGVREGVATGSSPASENWTWPLLEMEIGPLRRRSGVSGCFY
jgi:hypothetical protein